MIVGDLRTLESRTYPAGRATQNLVGGLSPVQCKNFCMGFVTLAPNGGQIPWHNQESEEVYFVIVGRAEMCLGDERRELTSGQVVQIPSGTYHQLTNVADEPLQLVYVYGPAGEVEHWRQELTGTLPKAGVDAPELPKNATPQFINPPM